MNTVFRSKSIELVELSAQDDPFVEICRKLAMHEPTKGELGPYDRPISRDYDVSPIEWDDDGVHYVLKLKPWTGEEYLANRYKGDKVQLKPEFVRRVLETMTADRDMARRYPRLMDYLCAKGCDPADWWKEKGEGLLDVWHYPDIWLRHLASGFKVECGGFKKEEAWKKVPTRKDYDRWYDTDEEVTEDELEYEDPLPNFLDRKEVSSFKPNAHVGPVSFKISNIDWDDWEERRKKPFIKSKRRVRLQLQVCKVKGVWNSMWNHLMDGNKNKVKPPGYTRPSLWIRVRRAWWVYQHRDDRFELEILEQRCSECGSKEIVKTLPDREHFYHSICQDCFAYLAEHYYYGRVPK
jgi:hypothetical protein